MKRKHSDIAGNGLMVLGLVIVIAGLAVSMVGQMPEFNFPQLIRHIAILGIFVGALMWLAGARIGGREKITDRYYWQRHCGDKRCRNGHSEHNEHSHQ